MQSRLTEPIKPTGEAEIMRLPKQSYAIDYESFDSMSSYLTHIKRLKATKIEPTRDKRIPLCLSMSLSEKDQHLARMWSMGQQHDSGQSTHSMLL